jgi:catechol 2,3-dioxygenase-like lactoylglutathione lyase family enzyme
MSVTFAQLEHINLRVPSIAATQALLCAAFPDFRLRGGGYGPIYGYWAHIGNDDHYVAVSQREKPGEESGESIPPYEYRQSYRLLHLAYVVDDVEALMARLHQAGFEPDDVDNLNDHPYRRRVYYLDGNGIEYEFVQYLSKKAEQRNDYNL